MKVLTIISKLEMGGIEKTLLSCIPYLKEKGVEMSVLCTLGGVLDEDYKKLGVKLIDFGPHKKPVKDAIYLKKVLQANSFDLVHSRYGHTSGLFAKVCSDLGIPFLISIHNEKAMFKNSWINKPVLGFFRSSYLNYHKNQSVKYATKIIGHSKANLKYYISHVDNLAKEGKFRVLYNGVDFSKFENYPTLESAKKESLDNFTKDKSKILIHIGSFKEQKNHDFLIDVFNQLKSKENQYGLILLGVGEMMSSIQEKVNNLGLTNQVFFVGMETNIAPYLFASDLFVFPSLYEGFGNVLIEGQFANLPIAASDIAPHYEATYKAYHTSFYDPKNVNEATEKIQKLLKENQSSKIEEAKMFAKDFSVENMAENLFEIFQEAINK